MAVDIALYVKFKFHVPNHKREENHRTQYQVPDLIVAEKNLIKKQKTLVNINIDFQNEK